MSFEGKEEGAELNAEQMTEKMSERQNVTVARDQTEQSPDGGQQVKAEANLVQNDEEITRKASKGHVYASFDDLRPQDRVEFNHLYTSAIESSPNQLSGKYYLCQTLYTMDKGRFSSIKGPALEVYVTGPGTICGMAIALHNYSFGRKSAFGLEFRYADILPPQSFLVVKNPKMATDGGFYLFCDNPAEVEIVSKKRVESKFPDLEWKAHDFLRKEDFWNEIEGDKAVCAKLTRLGNVGFVEKRFSDAIRFYDMALDYCGVQKEKEAMIQSNKCASLLALGCFHAALNCAEAALEVDPRNEKYNYRKTKTLIGLKKYEEAMSFLQEKFDQFPSLNESEDCKKLLENVQFLCSRNNLGPTDSQLISLHMKHLEVEDKIPEFTGPLALVSQMEGKGRGLVATEDIRPGQILICAKAFSFQETPPISNSTAVKGILAKFNQLNRGIGNTAAIVDKLSCQEETVKAIADKLLFDPELGSEFYNLTAGGDLGHLEHGDPKTRYVDMNRIKEILRINAFYSDRSEDDNAEEFTGLWILPSLFNHSCSEYNCVWFVCGEWMTVRAITEIKKGEELTLCYKSPIINYQERQIYFSSLGFTCSCKLCQMEAKEPKSVKNKRRKILRSVEELASNSDPREIEKALKAVERLVSLRKDNVSLNFPLLSPQIVQLTETLFCKNRFEDCISVLSAMFEVANSSVLWHDDGIYVATTMLACHALRMDREATKLWIVNVKRLMMKFYGNLELMRVKESVTVQLLQRQLGLDFFQDE